MGSLAFGIVVWCLVFACVAMLAMLAGLLVSDARDRKHELKHELQDAD